MLGGRAWVFSAIQGAKVINLTNGFSFIVESQIRTNGGQFAAGAAAEALAPAGLIDRQKRGYGPFQLGSPGIFGGLFQFLYSHN